MSNLFGEMLKRPIASIFVIGAIGSAASGIIAASKRRTA